MSSSTSSSKDAPSSDNGNANQVRPCSILLFFLLALAAWEGAIRAGLVPASHGIHQREDNLIRAESYLKRPEVVDQVYLGSSFTVRLPTADLGTRAFNLAFAGEGVFTGLAIVERDLRKPRTICVEMGHTLIRPESDELVASLFGPEGVMRQYLSCLERRYQPVSVLTAAYSRYRDSLAGPAKPVSPKTQAMRDARLAKAVAAAGERYKAPLDEKRGAAIKAAALTLRERLKTFLTEGNRVVLYRLPSSEPADAGRFHQNVQKIYDEVFPQAEWSWVMPPKGQAWTTSDGEHLDEPSAKRMAAFLQESAQALESR